MCCASLSLELYDYTSWSVCHSVKFNVKNTTQKLDSQQSVVCFCVYNLCVRFSIFIILKWHLLQQIEIEASFVFKI